MSCTHPDSFRNYSINLTLVNIAVPLTPETKGLIGQHELRAMKKTAFLINVARGKIIDENALIKALKEDWIAGAGLDVFETEPIDPNNELWFTA